MAPVKTSNVGQRATTAPVAAVGVVQREINDGIEFSYLESASSGGVESAPVGVSGSDRFQGYPLPGLTTEYVEEKEKAISAGTPPVLRASSSSFKGAPPSGDAGFGAASFGGAYSGTGAVPRGTFQQENIIGADTRERITDTGNDPYKWICLLEMTSPNGTPLMGTGWLCGNGTLVTAGHCVYNHDSRYGVGAMQKITVYAGRDKSNWQGDAIATSTNTTKEWVNNADVENDYAAVQLSAPLGQQLKFFQFAEFSDSDLQNLMVNIAGYPADKNNLIYGTMWGAVNKITSVAPQRLGYLVDTTGGESGSPVMAFDGTSIYYAIGIHNYGGDTANFATRINSQVFERISGWVK